MGRVNFKVKVPIESQVKRPVIRYARNNHLLAINLRLLGVRGIPDTLILGPGKAILFIEFKRPGGEPRKLQQRVIDKMRGWGFNVIVCDDEDEGKKAIKNWFLI